MYVSFIPTEMSHACLIICRFRWPYLLRWGTAVPQWLRCCASNRKVAGSIPEVSLELFVDVILLITLWPLSQLSLLQKRLKGLFPGGKNIRCVRLTNLTPSWAFVMPSDNLKFVEPSVHLGPVMRLIYLFNPLKCRSPALRLLCSFVRILFRTWIFFSCGCCLLQCRCLGKLITRLEDSYWICMRV